MVTHGNCFVFGMYLCIGRVVEAIVFWGVYLYVSVSVCMCVGNLDYGSCFIFPFRDGCKSSKDYLSPGVVLDVTKVNMMDFTL